MNNTKKNGVSELLAGHVIGWAGPSVPFLH